MFTMKNAIVTGASGGVGLAVIENLAQDGYNIWALAHNKNDEFEMQIKEMREKYQVSIEPYYLDLNDTAAIKEIYRKINRQKKQIHVLINNAGIGHMGLVQMTDIDTVKTIYGINVIAPVYLSQLVIRNMAHYGGGKIINISSIAAEEVYEGNAIYGATKAALTAFTKSFALEAARYNVTVNAIAPGLIDTKMSSIFEGTDPEKPISHTPLKRKIRPDEVADVISCLLDERMNIINGDVICVTGGHSL